MGFKKNEITTLKYLLDTYCNVCCNFSDLVVFVQSVELMC